FVSSFNDTAISKSYTLSLHDALPILIYGTKRLEEKVTQIRLYNGQKFLTVDQVQAGELFAVSGLTEASVGDSVGALQEKAEFGLDRKSTRLNSSHVKISYAVFCLKKK